MKIISKIHDIIWTSDFMSVRFTTALASLFWGIFLLWPADTFLAQPEIYRLMGQVATEHIWGLAFLIHAFFGFYALLKDKTTVCAFSCDLLLGTLLWTTSTFCCLLSFWQINIPYIPPATMAADIGITISLWWRMIKYIVKERLLKNGT